MSYDCADRCTPNVGNGTDPHGVLLGAGAQGGCLTIADGVLPMLSWHWISREQPPAPTNIQCQIFNTELTRDPKKVIYSRKGVAGHPTCPLSDVLAVAKEYANGSRIGPTPSFRHKMQVFLNNALRYFVVIDVMVQHSPEITALVWGCIRMCIMV
jgi:hypothetical protein